MANLYAQASAAWASANWNDQADGLGNAGSPQSGDICSANGFDVDVADVDTSVFGLDTMSGGTFWTSKLYATEDGAFASIDFASAPTGGLTSGATAGTSILHYTNGHKVNVDYVDVETYRLASDSWYSSHWEALGSGNWGSVTWQAKNPGTNATYQTTAPRIEEGVELDACSYAINYSNSQLGGCTLQATVGGSWTCNTWYAQNSGAVSGVTFTSAATNGAPGSSHSGDTWYSNGYTIDLADVETTGMSLSGNGWTSSKWYSTGGVNVAWSAVTFNAQYAGQGLGLVGSPSGTCTVILQETDLIDMADVDLTGITLVPNGDTTHSSKWYATLDGVTYANQVWNAERHVTGISGAPTAGTTAYANGRTTTAVDDGTLADRTFRLGPDEPLGTFVLGASPSGFVAVSDIVSEAWVVTGHKSYTGGPDGNYPTQETSKAAQLADDTAAVASAADKIQTGTTILGVAGTLPEGVGNIALTPGVYTLIVGGCGGL